MEKPASYRIHPDVIPFPANRATKLDGETTPYLTSTTSTTIPPAANVVQLAAHRQPLTSRTTRASGEHHPDRP
ncbi:MAG: hypothetical protein ABIQ63_06590 [Rhodanobacter sp.]